MTTPTVGSHVWFWPARTMKLRHPGSETQPFAAIVTHVWSDTSVNLAVFDSNGALLTEPPTSVPLVKDAATRPHDAHFWEWPNQAPVSAAKPSVPAPLKTATPPPGASHVSGQAPPAHLVGRGPTAHLPADHAKTEQLHEHPAVSLPATPRPPHDEVV